MAAEPVALVSTPLAAIGRLEAEVVKFWEEDAHSPLGEMTLACPDPVVVSGGWIEVTNKGRELAGWLISDV